MKSAPLEYYHSAFAELESPIGKAFQQSLVLRILAQNLDHDSELDLNGSIAPKAIVFMIGELGDTLRSLDEQHLRLHNAGPDDGGPV